MRILFFKSVQSSFDRSAKADREPAVDKMRRILESHVEESETDEDRERAERELAKFTASAISPNPDESYRHQGECKQ